MLMDKSSIHERSVFQLGDWNLVKTGFQQGDGFAGIFAVHTGCAPTKWNAMIHNVDNICFRCGDVVPDELQGLIALYRWDGTSNERS